MWDIAAQENTLYGVGYGMPGTEHAHLGIRLYRSEEGTVFTPQANIRQENQHEELPMRATETTLAFHHDLAIALLRREFWSRPVGKPRASALLGTAKPPYSHWQWHELEHHIGGPKLLVLPSGQIIAGGRTPFPQSHTALWAVDLEKKQLHPLIILPSANDSSYPGMIWHEDKLWVSYYSTHEGKTCIYFAELSIN